MKLLVIILLLLAIGIPLAEGQFGVANKAKEKTKDSDSSELGKKLQEAAIDERGNVDAQYEGMAKKLQSIAPISIEDATDIAVLLEAVKADAETGALIAQMQKAEGEGGALQAFINDITPYEIVIGLKQSIDEIKAIEILFADPQRAVVEMDKEGMIDKKRVDFYKKNPDVLKEDTRKGNFFTFVSLGVAGGYL
jgi:hypothetical protein